MTAGATSPFWAAFSGPATLSRKRLIERWFFPGLASLMIATAMAGFAPAILNPVGRRGPVSALVAAHGIVFFAWLLLFLVQTSLIASNRITWHWGLGVVSLFLLAAMAPLGYESTIAMVRRGYDLSGDQYVGFSSRHAFLDAQTGSAFNLISLALFVLLALSALWFRGRPAIHKRLMLFANFQLTSASIAHLLGHASLLSGPTVIGGFSLFLIAAVVGDWFVYKKVHALTAALSVISFVCLPIEGLIGPSPAWHHLIDWLARTA